ncbi:Transcriptional activator [Hypoxylon texense]
MPATTKPKLAQLTTPVTATFPSELSALSARTPLSAVPDFIKEEFPSSAKTPISPPTAYMDFLKAMSVSSPVLPGKRSGSTSSDDDSALSTPNSEQTDCSCKCGNHKSPNGIPPSPFPSQPMSAPPTGATSFPSLHMPPSPAVSTLDSPLSATARSPFSARSVRSPFDWEAALKSRYAQDCRAQKSSAKSVRHIREVVTRTVTYTPRMEPAPKGKRRKTTHLDCPKAQAAAAAVAATAAVARTNTV